MSFNRCVYRIQNTEENNYDFCVNPKRCLGENMGYCYYGSEERAKSECVYHYGDNKVMADLDRVSSFIKQWVGSIKNDFNKVKG